MLGGCSYNYPPPLLSLLYSPNYHIQTLPISYLISLHADIFNSSTAPRYSVTPPHTTSLSPDISHIINLVTAEATSTRLLNRPLSHVINVRTFNEGSASSVTSTKLGQPYNTRSFNEGSASSVTSTKLGQPIISRFCKRGNTAPDHFFHPRILSKRRISSEENA
ncbi:hypothetical protein Hanom_Chr04g00294761 [Helianthus anomalus]